MENLFVSYEQALQLKGLGFNEPCLKVGNPNGHILWKFMDVLDVEGVDIGDIMKEKFDDRFVEIPLKQQVFRWFRDNHNTVHVIDCIDSNFRYNIYYMDIWISGVGLAENLYVSTYEKAESACIYKLIEIVKNK